MTMWSTTRIWSRWRGILFQSKQNWIEPYASIFGGIRLCGNCSACDSTWNFKKSVDKSLRTWYYPTHIKYSKCSDEDCRVWAFPESRLSVQGRYCEHQYDTSLPSRKPENRRSVGVFRYAALLAEGLLEPEEVLKSANWVVPRTNMPVSWRYEMGIFLCIVFPKGKTNTAQIMRWAILCIVFPKGKTNTAQKIRRVLFCVLSSLKGRQTPLRLWDGYFFVYCLP